MTQLVGILNFTPDSFSDGGKYFSLDAAIRHADELFQDGASIVDVGAESTRPNAVPLLPGEEWERLVPVLEVLIPKYRNKISVDSYHPETIERALSLGPIIVNDVTGLNDPHMIDVILREKPTVIVSYLPAANVATAHSQPPVTSVVEVKYALLAKAEMLEKHGLKRNQIILDPGIGFGKSQELNRELLSFAKEIPEYQVMIGYSRKRFLGPDRMQLEANLEAGKIAIDSGASYLRVHDVKGHMTLLNK